MGDQPISGKYHEDHVFSDNENIYAYEKKREALQVYPQRTTDIVVVETGIQVRIQTHIIMSPTIYGVGTGLFNKLSIQIPTLTRTAIKAGQPEVIGQGKAEWDYVHIADLAQLYVLLVRKIVAGAEIPSGESGILFSATGRYSWLELAQAIGNALLKLKVIQTNKVRSIDLPTAADKWSGGAQFVAELGYASK